MVFLLILNLIMMAMLIMTKLKVWCSGRQVLSRARLLVGRICVNSFGENRFYQIFIPHYQNNHEHPYDYHSKVCTKMGEHVVHFRHCKNLFNGQAGHKSWPPHLIDSNLWHLFGIILGLFYHFRYKSKGGMGGGKKSKSARVKSAQSTSSCFWLFWMF